MPSIKLSELPVFTGDSSGSHIVINDSGNTATYTTQKELFFTSSLYGTSSWSKNSVSSSYVQFSQTASYVESASYSVTSSYSNYSLSSSNSLTASYVEASNVVGLNLSQISSGSATASIQPGLFNVNTDTNVQGNLTASNFLTQGTITAQTLFVQYVTASTELVTGSTKFGTQLTDTHQFTGSVSVSGSLFATSSWATNSVTASYVLNAISSSFSSTASFVNQAQTASYVLNAVSSSFSSTASFVTFAQTASFVATASLASRAITASFVATASWAINAITASYALTSSIAQINQSQYRFELVTTIDQDIWLYPATVTRVVKSPGVFSAQYRTGSAEAFNSISFTGNESTTPIAVKANDEFSWRIVYSSGYTTAALTVVSQRT